MIATRRGVSRTVLLIGPWAVKLPSFRHGPVYFVYGLLGNLLEAERWALSRHKRLAPVLWCAPLGALLVMRRARGPVVGRLLSKAELAQFPFTDATGGSGVDNNGHNVTVEPCGGLLLVDYGDPGMYLVL